jgi:hypothetical protein
MLADSKIDTRWTELPIVCPFCGNRGEAEGVWETNAAVPFKLVEEVVRSFEFSVQVDVDGWLFIEADVETDEVDWESGSGVRLECISCFGQFPVPDGADIDFD